MSDQELPASNDTDQYRAFLRFFTVHVLVFFVHLVAIAGTADGGVILDVTVVVASLACAIVCWRWEAKAPFAMALLTAICVVELVVNWPGGANHLYLFVPVAAVAATFRPTKDRERAVAVSTWIGLTLIVFFLTGLQKVLHGTYFDGQFMGIFVDAKSGFGWFVGLLDADELAYYESLQQVGVGTGPYNTQSMQLRILSNSVWLLEIVAPIAVLWPRWRAVWVVTSMLFALSIQFAAREFIFGLAFSSMLSLMLPQRWSVRWLRIALLASLSLLVLHFVAPDFYFN